MVSEEAVMPEVISRLAGEGYRHEGDPGIRDGRLGRSLLRFPNIICTAWSRARSRTLITSYSVITFAGGPMKSSATAR
ncbi:hypothetical protein BV882_16140 [Streptomyces sp. 46]|nr:hypothetical protein BV882_16140 [Streptomyces sp. 46]